MYLFIQIYIQSFVHLDIGSVLNKKLQEWRNLYFVQVPQELTFTPLFYSFCVSIQINMCTYVSPKDLNMLINNSDIYQLQFCSLNFFKFFLWHILLI
jgi:hypothetical protein